MTPATLALIGKGKWGTNYIKTIQSLPSCNLPSKYIKTHDYKDLLDQRPDGIIIATPTNTHFQIAKIFIENDFNILIEKPLTQTYPQAQKLQKLHQCHPSSTIMVGHIQLYDPAYTKIKNHIKQGLIGNITAINYEGLQSPVRQDATVLEDWGPHPIYLFLDLTQQEPSSVSAQKLAGDNLRLTLKFPNQITAKANISWTGPKRKRLLSITGTKGTLTLDNSQPPKKMFFTNNNSQVQNLDFPTTPSPLAAQILEFVKAIETNQQPHSPLKQGIQIMKFIDLATKSLSSSPPLTK